MSGVDAAAVVAGVIWLAGMPAILRRVQAEYERRGVLSDGTVWAVWLSYGLLTVAIVAAALSGTWGLGLGSTLGLVLGISLLVAGLALDLAGIASMGSVARMNGQDPDRLITRGAFRYSRNPQNVGIGIAALGAAVLGSSGLALALVAAGAGVLRIYLRLEEAHLERTFGQEFVDYMGRAPRFLGLPRR